MNTLDCPLCHGEGSLEEVIPGGYFDASAECWYPLEHLVECPECGGCGSLELEDDEFNWERAA